MKIKELLNELSKLDPENDVYVNNDGKLLAVDMVSPGQFLKTINLTTRVEFDVIRAEQTLISCLMYQRHNLTGAVYERISRAIGKERMEMIISDFDSNKKVQEENTKLVEDITEKLNAENIYEEEKTPSVKKKKSSKKTKSAENEDPEELLMNYYSGKTEIDIQKVKDAKKLVGDEKAAEIFKKARGL